MTGFISLAKADAGNQLLGRSILHYGDASMRPAAFPASSAMIDIRVTHRPFGRG
jgi:hypothetical protein